MTGTGSALLVEQLQPDDAPAPPGAGALLAAESLRLWSRRLVRVLLMLGAVGYLAALLLASTQYAQPSAAGLADATARRQQVLAQQEQYRQDCLTQVGTAQGPPTVEQCGPQLTADDIGRIQDFIDKQPFTLNREGRGGVLVVAAATAVFAFLLGATYVGAEWSSRSMVALLFWEPRRYRVMAVKLAVLTGVAAALGVLSQGVWLLAARVLAATRGTTSSTPTHLWTQLTAASGRGVLLVVLVALLGFAVANLIRNTAAAFGAGFVYFAIVENVIRAVRPAWQPWLLSDNAVALVTHGGHRPFSTRGSSTPAASTSPPAGRSSSATCTAGCSSAAAPHSSSPPASSCSAAETSTDQRPTPDGRCPALACRSGPQSVRRGVRGRCSRCGASSPTRCQCRQHTVRCLPTWSQVVGSSDGGA